MRAKTKNTVIGIGALVVIVAVIATLMAVQFNRSTDLYKNQLSLSELQEKLNKNEDTFVYFYQHNCEYCQNVAPYMIPLAEKTNTPLFPLNIQKYSDGWDLYNIEGTPTVVHYRGGKEVKRIVGEHPEEDYEAFFTQQ
ncbi:thioredoxin family protein [Brevibacillus massiliensis]|uniref:thioredoxin family protein n=1 Tax=Brevibacillus massiliensis TaxID=1118054 RepID=UPI000318D7A3|nr:thioredoxin family protein [Brevibacillus massiliensis]